MGSIFEVPAQARASFLALKEGCSVQFSGNVRDWFEIKGGVFLDHSYRYHRGLGMSVACPVRVCTPEERTRILERVARGEGVVTRCRDDAEAVASDRKARQELGFPCVF